MNTLSKKPIWVMPVLCAWALSASAELIETAIDIESLRPTFGQNNIATLLLKHAVATGCPADADKRLTIEMGAMPAAQQRLTAIGNAMQSSQPLAVTIDNSCDDTGAARVTAINE